MRTSRTICRLAGALSLTMVGSLQAAATGTMPDSTWVMDHVRYLADPICEGRGVGTQGLEHAAEYLEKEFRELGLAPAGEAGGYRQEVEVVTGVRVHDPTDLTIHETVFRAGMDFNPLGFSASGEATAEVVFAGYGITAPEYDYDDYAGLDVADKFVLVLRYEPGEMDTNSVFAGDVNTAHAELRTKAINAREHGALGLLVVTGPRYHGEDDDLIEAKPDAGYMSAGILAAHVTREAVAPLFSHSDWSLSQLQELIDIHNMPKSTVLNDSLHLRISLEKQRAFVHNIVGVVRGRDTTRTLVIGAHYDHLGKSSDHSLASEQDTRYHLGADDNASGTAALLALARAWTSRSETPHHNIVFAAFAAEELGVLGSNRYVMGPPFPIGETIAMLNFDMVGRLRERRLIVMGTGTADGLESLVLQTAEPFDLDLRMTQDGYGPSDHTSFYKMKVPVLSFFTGVHTDYHKPSDTWDKLNGKGIVEVASYAYALSESLVTRPTLQYAQVVSSAQFGRIGGGSGHGAYLGTIPDYSQEEGGVKLSGTSEGGPADLAGIQGGDVIVAFDGVRIDNIYDFTYALRTRKPGQEVKIDVLRAGDRITLTATLGKRSRSH